MKIYKVYSQACKVAKPIKEVDSGELTTEGFYKCIDHMAEQDQGPFADADWDDENNVTEIFGDCVTKLLREFHETGCLECGDYMFIRTDDDMDMSSITRPNSCGWTKC